MKEYKPDPQPLDTKDLVRFVTAEFWKISNALSSVGKREVQINAFAVARGASAPTQALRAAGASGGVQIPVLQFASNVQNDIYVEIHAPSDLIPTIQCAVHLMWIPGASWTTGNFVWKIEYLMKSESGTVTTGTPTTLSVDVTPANAVTFIESELFLPTMIQPDNTILAHIYRDVAADNGNSTGDLRFIELEYYSVLGGEGE